MKWSPFVCAILLAAPLTAQGADSADRLLTGGGGAPRPPVLRGGEASDNLVLTLPGPVATPRPSINPPAPQPAEPGDQLDDPADHRPLLRRAPKPVLPAEFERDSAIFTQKLIGLWSEPDAYNLFGEPLRQRVLLDETDNESGRIYAFSDPTGRYRELELDFAKDTGLLRTVIAYPWK